MDIALEMKAGGVLKWVALCSCTVIVKFKLNSCSHFKICSQSIMLMMTKDDLILFKPLSIETSLPAVLEMTFTVFHVVYHHLYHCHHLVGPLGVVHGLLPNTGYNSIITAWSM